MLITAERETLYLQEQRIKPRRRRFVRRNPTMVGGMVLLGLMFIMTVLASNLIGDGWCDTLDPKLARCM